MGSSIQHPRESEQWRGMTMEQRYEFFAPIWRVMRDSAMPVEEVSRSAQPPTQARVFGNISPAVSW